MEGHTGGSRALTITDFEIWPWSDISAYDPSDLDFVMWLGWRQLTNHLYVAVAATDDSYVNEFGSDDNYYGDQFVWDHVAIAIDGDHSGGRWIDPAVVGHRRLQDVLQCARAELRWNGAVTYRQ